MHKLLKISDVKKSRAPKILYIANDNCITAYFFKNSANLDAKKIIARVNTGLFDFHFRKGCITLGELTTTDDNWLNHVFVNNKYQNMGIGTQLLKFAIDYLDLQYIGCVKENQAYDCCLSDAGEQLILSCLKKGIVTPAMCIFAGHPNLYAENEADDPGQISSAIAHALSNSNLNSLKRSRSENSNLNPLKRSHSENSHTKTLTYDYVQINSLFFANVISPMRPFLTKTTTSKPMDQSIADLKQEFATGFSDNPLDFENREPNRLFP